MKTIAKKLVVALLVATMLVSIFAMTGCASNPVKIEQDGTYKFAAIDGAKHYVLELWAEEDIENGVVKADAKAALKQTVQAVEGTIKIELPFGRYTPTVYAVKEDKSQSEMVYGNVFALGGKLTAPDFVLQRDYATAKISITDKMFDDFYFNNETVYSFTAEVYTSKDCSGSPVATATFGEDAVYTAPTNSTVPIWIENRSVNIDLANGTYYVRVKANGNKDDNVEDSDWSAVKSLTVDGTSTDVKYVTYELDMTTGLSEVISDVFIEFGNGSRQKFNVAKLVYADTDLSDNRNSFVGADFIKDGDLYTVVTTDGTALCLHLAGKEGDKSGYAYSHCARPMPVDKPLLEGEWKFVDDDTIHIIIMDDFQYFTDPANEKTT